MPQTHHPRHLWPLGPTASTPDLTPQQPNAAPTFVQHSEVSIQSSDPLLKPSQPPPSTLPAAVESLNQTTPKSIGSSEGSADMSIDMSGVFANPDDSNNA